MTVKEIMLKKWRTAQELTKEQENAYSLKPSGYVTIRYALNHHRIPTSNYNIKTFKTKNLHTNEFYLYSYVNWDDCRIMTREEIQEYEKINDEQERWLKQTNNSVNKQTEKKDFQDKLRNISLCDSYYVRDDDTFDYRQRREESYNHSVSNLILKKIDLFSKEEFLDMAKEVYKKDFDDLNVGTYTFNRILESIYKNKEDITKQPTKENNTQKKDNSMTNKRLKIVINNLLTEVCDKVWECSSEQYIPWLKSEIGLTDDEINELREQNCLPEPSAFER